MSVDHSIIIATINYVAAPQIFSEEVMLLLI
jgi:hypothetical protein